MARMIPPVIDPTCRSPGERLLFSKLARDPDTHGWVVLHSLAVAHHPTRTEGEIDFVVMVPGHGILCVEVKSGRVSRRQGVWYFGRSGTLLERGRCPFRQAAEGMHALRRHCSIQRPELSHLLFFSAVVFTDIEFAEVSPEWHPWQIVDRKRLTRQPVSRTLVEILEAAHQLIASRPAVHWYHPQQSRPSADQIRELVSLLRSDFDYALSPKTVLDLTERQIARFTQEQIDALDLVDENDRILFKGSAGTGKTFLAIEAARRSALSGQRTLVVCYNRLLAAWLRAATRDFIAPAPTRVEVATLHSLMLRAAGTAPPAHPDPEFWLTDLPARAINSLLHQRPARITCDYLVMDEAQDLLHERYMDVLDLLLDGGLSAGRWVMFGDLENQAIYGRDRSPREIQSLLTSRAPHHVIFPLRVNCRNASPIAGLLEILCQPAPGYSRVLQAAVTPSQVRLVLWDSIEDASQKLVQVLRELGTHLRPHEIVILSARDDRSCLAATVRKQGTSFPLRPLEAIPQGEGHTSFTTIHAFKGLEAPAVIITDIENPLSSHTRALLYVGASRARVWLYIFLPSSQRLQWVQLIHRGLQ